jgi:hypothetical protein
MLKKAILLTGLALAAVALAAPASALAQKGTLFDEGAKVPAGNHATLPTTGVISFDFSELASSFGCLAHPELTLKSGHPSTGTVTSFSFTTDDCSGTGLLTGCELASDETNKPAVDVTATSLEVTDFTFTAVFKEGCIVPVALWTFPVVTATPDDTAEISGFELEGEGVDDVTELAMEATGELEIAGKGNGTYGIG